MRILLLSFITLSVLIGCGTNPVTGKRQITLMSPAQEIAIGKQQYSPSQQSQGGSYLVDKAVNDYVNRVGQKLARLSDQPNLPYEFVVLNNSVPNAWALPGGKIAINRGLLVLLEDEAQLAAVLGHEIVHAAARHGAEQQATGTLLQGSAVIAGAFTNNQLYRQAAGVLAMGASARYGRDNELEADKYGMNYMSAAGYDVNGAVELQKTFVKLSQQSGRKSDLFSALFASHPPSQERVDKNLNRASRFPKGVRNRAAFLKATRQLRKDQPAYKKHESALKAASQKNWNRALSLTNQAIKMQPREARFHVTKGRLLGREKPSKQALSAFNQAIKLEPGYFAPHLYRGLMYNELKNYSRAERDFLASYQLLPSQPASFYLGEIAQRNNQRQKAINYYKRAAQSGGNYGKEAAGRLQRLGVQ